MELRKIEPLFVLLTLLALVACVSRFVPDVAQAPAQASKPRPAPASASAYTSLPGLSLTLRPSAAFVVPPAASVVPPAMGPLAPQVYLPIELPICALVEPQADPADGVHLTLSLKRSTWRWRG